MKKLNGLLVRNEIADDDIQWELTVDNEHITFLREDDVKELIGEFDTKADTIKLLTSFELEVI